MPRRVRVAVSAVGVLAIALAAMWFSSRGVDRAELVAAFEGVSWGWVALAGLANAITVITQGWAWQIGLAAGGAGQVPARHAIAATWIAKAGNQLLPGKMGEVARVALIRSHLEPGRRELPRIVGTLVAQRALNVLATLVVVVAVASTITLPVDLPGGRWAPLALLGLVTWVAVIAARRPTRARDGAHAGRLRSILRNFADGTGLLRPTRATLGALGLHLIAVLSLLTTYECLLRGFDVATPVTAPLLIIALVALVGAVPGAPGGVGLNQAALVGPLGAAYGVDPASALAFALGLQATVALVAVIGGGLALLHQGRARLSRTAFA